jgi:hypothetical protein
VRISSGPITEHYSSSDDWTTARVVELDAKTVQALLEGKPRTLMIDHLLDRAAGRELTPAERSARRLDLLLPSDDVDHAAGLLERYARGQIAIFVGGNLEGDAHTRSWGALAPSDARGLRPVNGRAGGGPAPWRAA